MSEPLLTIRNLRASVDDKEVLKGIDLSVAAGEVAAIMGPNGSGKSTLSNVLAGRDGYEVTDGEVRYDGQDLLAMEPEERAATGVFMAFQYPVEIPGVVNATFTRTALNAQRKARDESAIDAIDFLKRARATLARLEMDEDFLRRDVNAGFSGGEKKRNEILQMTVLEPTLAVLDETDSGLDIDALRIVADGVNALRSPERAFVVVTHHERFLEYVVPDHVHVLYEGKVARSGGRALARELEERGYGHLREERAA
jgi:Fe-S cluster assembly ATP-binding protein